MHTLIAMYETRKGEIIILGMGNKFFGDDGIGIIIAEKLKNYLIDFPQIQVEETNWGGFRIIDLLAGYKSAIIIDALKTGKEPAGYIHQLDYKDLINSVRMVSFHDINFATAVEFAKQVNIPMPENISVYAIEIKEADHFSETLTEEVNTSVNECVEMILNDLTKRFGIEINHHEETAIN